MSLKTKEESNALIDEFMGRKGKYCLIEPTEEIYVCGCFDKKSIENERVKFLELFGMNCEVHPDNLDYLNSWDALMLVVEKIETMSHTKGRHYYLHKGEASVQIRVDRMNICPFGKWGTYGNSNVMIAIYRAVVDFIEKYNKRRGCNEK